MSGPQKIKKSGERGSSEGDRSEGLNRPSVMLPENFYDSNLEDDINFFTDEGANASSGPRTSEIPRFQEFEMSSGPEGYAVYNPSNIIPESPIEDALMDAIGNAKERMNALRIEKELFEFVCSGRPVLEIPHQNNSFKRLLTYKIAQRFGLEHKSMDYVLENGERSVFITIFRTPGTYIPRPLLIDVTRATEAERGFAPQMPSNPRVMVMKRTVNLPSERSGMVHRQVQSVEDKERKYLAARARIFGEEEDPMAEGLGEGIGMQDKTESPILSEANSRRGDSPLSKSKESPEGTTQEEDQDYGDGRRNSRGKRSVMRNKDAEKADPDFTRRSDPRVYPSPMYPYVVPPQYPVPYPPFPAPVYAPPVYEMPPYDPYRGNPYYASMYPAMVPPQYIPPTGAQMPSRPQLAPHTPQTPAQPPAEKERTHGSSEYPPSP